MVSKRTVRGTCHVCGIESDHDIVAMHSDGIGFCFGMECPACGTLVPEKSWQRYQKTGEIVVSNMFRGKGPRGSIVHQKTKPGRYI